MADAPAAKPDDKKDEAPKKKLPVMLLGIVGGVMAVEAAGVFLVVRAMMPSPQAAVAKHIEGADAEGGHGSGEAKAEGEHGKPEASAGGEHGGGGEHGAKADDTPKDPETPIEIALVSDKFQNMSSGGAWIWDADIVIQAKAKNQKFIEGKIKSRDAEVKEGVSMIFRKATLNQLKEPGLETLNRQITAFINKMIEPDADGKSRVMRILIPKCRGFPTD